ncbi:LysE family translocator [Streptomyces uncialis]|uniref:LysE family translocator n=1 Tax=Streptomyces uncialis TaxID=1048205 RepID=UPI00379A043B
MPVELAGFVAVVLIAYLIPGPDFLVIVRAAAVRPALGRAAALGAQTGLCVHMVLAALGLSSVAAQSADAFTAVKLAGAAYLIYLGARALLTARHAARLHNNRTAHPSTPPPAGATGSGSAGAWRARFTEGLLTNILNPKAALFFLSVLPQFVTQDGSATQQIFLLGTLDVLVGIAYWAALVPLAGRLGALMNKSSFRRRWEQTTGCLLIATGTGVALTN